MTSRSSTIAAATEQAMSLPKEVQLFVINSKFLSRRKVELLVLKGFFRKSQAIIVNLSRAERLRQSILHRAFTG